MSVKSQTAQISTVGEVGVMNRQPAAVLRIMIAAVLVFISQVIAPAQAQAPSNPDDLTAKVFALGWQRGVSDGRIGEKATIYIPRGYMFIDALNRAGFAGGVLV